MPRHALHAKTLGFIHPKTEKILKLDSEVPMDFKEVLAKWKKYVSYIED